MCFQTHFDYNPFSRLNQAKAIVDLNHYEIGISSSLYKVLSRNGWTLKKRGYLGSQGVQYYTHKTQALPESSMLIKQLYHHQQSRSKRFSQYEQAECLIINVYHCQKEGLPQNVRAYLLNRDWEWTEAIRAGSFYLAGFWYHRTLDVPAFQTVLKKMHSEIKKSPDCVIEQVADIDEVSYIKQQAQSIKLKMPAGYCPTQLLIRRLAPDLPANHIQQIINELNQ